MSSSGSSNGAGNRWQAALDEEEDNEEMVENVYIEDSDEEEETKLENTFDVEGVVM